MVTAQPRTCNTAFIISVRGRNNADQATELLIRADEYSEYFKLWNFSCWNNIYVSCCKLLHLSVAWNFCTILIPYVVIADVFITELLKKLLSVLTDWLLNQFCYVWNRRQPRSTKWGLQTWCTCQTNWRFGRSSWKLWPLLSAPPLRLSILEPRLRPFAPKSTRLLRKKLITKSRTSYLAVG